jgi:hypothetical protein
VQEVAEQIKRQREVEARKRSLQQMAADAAKRYVLL